MKILLGLFMVISGTLLILYCPLLFAIFLLFTILPAPRKDE